MGSQQLEIDVAKEFLFTLREVGLETEALQGAYYKGLTPVPQDQQVPLGKLRVGGHCWKEALAECEEFREAYKQGKETSGQVTDAKELHRGSVGVLICPGHVIFVSFSVFR